MVLVFIVLLVVDGEVKRGYVFFMKRVGVKFIFNINREIGRL